MDPFVVPYKGMKLNIKDWFKDKNEWISFITLLVQDKNEVKLGDVTFIMEDPESIASISGILWYKIFPDYEGQLNNKQKILSELKTKNKIKKIDNPWYIYQNPILMQFSSNKGNYKSMDLNQDQIQESVKDEPLDETVIEDITLYDDKSQDRVETSDNNDEVSPQLFSDEVNNEASSENNFDEVFKSEEEDFEIPAFLRKQKF